MENIFDTHAHYTDEAFDKDREELLASLFSHGICGIIECGTNVTTSKQCVALSQRFSSLYAAVGMWPHDVADAESDWLEQLAGLAQNPQVVAIGEIGLDYHYDTVSKEDQLVTLECQLSLAKELCLPVVIHSREAQEDTLRLLKAYRPQGVVHCFSGSIETAREVVKLGMYLGLGGAVTFKNAKKPASVAREIPLESLLLETDAPYMTPVPHRGQRCDSSMIPYTAQKIAELRNMDAQELIHQCTCNAKRLFSV